jgi:glucuronoarabinoxylan endo-1,4-beta-xylanase
VQYEKVPGRGWRHRRSYGLLTEDGNVSKRGYLMAQYAKFIRPGFKRVAASKPSASNVFVTAFAKDARLVVVAVNMSTSAQSITLDIHNDCVASLAKYTTSASKNVSADGMLTLTDNRGAAMLDAQSVTTFVSN